MEKPAIEKLYDRLRYLTTSGAGNRIEKYILSLYNPDEYPYSIGDILSAVDPDIAREVIQAAVEYRQHGETAELRRVGKLVYQRRFPKDPEDDIPAIDDC